MKIKRSHTRKGGAAWRYKEKKLLQILLLLKNEMSHLYPISNQKKLWTKAGKGITTRFRMQINEKEYKTIERIRKAKSFFSNILNWAAKALARPVKRKKIKICEIWNKIKTFHIMEIRRDCSFVGGGYMKIRYKKENKLPMIYWALHKGKHIQKWF